MKAVGYLRVSGRNQINGDGFDRQEKSIRSFAGKNSYELTDVYKEHGVSGTTNEQNRPAFQEMITDIIAQGTDTVIIEGMDRLARELRVQENLCIYIAMKGLNLISSNTGENITKAMEGDPMKKALIQMQGVFAELEKNQIVRKLRNGRNAARIKNKEKGNLTLSGHGKCEGRPSYQQIDPELIRHAKRLARRNPKTGKKRSLRTIAKELYELNYMTRTRKAFSANQIKNLLK
jgi:DNA invertase Pin-like site-specific DNA recombinase